MRLIDYLKKRKNIVELESEGFNSAIHCICEFEGRKFTFKALQKKYKGIDSDKLLKLLEDELNNMFIIYRYMTKVKKYTDRKGQPQLHLRLIGKAGMMSKYNPLNIQLDIMTEADAK